MQNQQAAWWDADPVVEGVAAPSSSALRQEQQGGQWWANDPVVEDDQSQTQPASLGMEKLAPGEGYSIQLKDPTETQSNTDNLVREAAAEGANRAGVYDQRQEPSFFESVGNVFTGAERETRATQELPELGSSGLLAGLDITPAKAAQLSATLALTPDPAEIGRILREASPDIGLQQDEKGNLIAANNRTGIRAVINKPGLSGLDAMQGTATTAAFVPAAAAVPAAAGPLAIAGILGLGSAATEAAIQGLQDTAGGEFDGADVAVSGALGAAAPLAMGAAGSLIDKGRRLAGAVRNPAQGANAQLVEQARQADIPLMTSDVFPPETFMKKSAQVAGERIPFAGTGSLRSAQQEARQKAIQELGTKYPQPGADQVVDSLLSQQDRIKQAAGRRYRELIPKVDAAGNASYAKTLEAIDQAIAEFRRPNVMQAGNAADELMTLRQALQAGPQTYSTLKENRTVLKDIIDAYDSPARGAVLPSRHKALLQGVRKALSDDMDATVRANLGPVGAYKLKQADAIYAQEFERLTRTRLKEVFSKGSMTPETANTLLFSNKPSEVRLLYQSLDNDGRAAARATIINRAIERAGGAAEASLEKFTSEMRRLQNHVGIFFKGDERKQLEGLAQVLKATKRAGEAGVQTATGQQMYSIGAATAAVASGLKAVPIAGTIGGFARLYESAPVRNALIRLAEQPNSRASAQAARELAVTLMPYLQAGTGLSGPEMPAAPAVTLSDYAPLEGGSLRPAVGSRAGKEAGRLNDQVNAPEVGHIEGGFEFLGGDPAKPESWRKLPPSAA